VKIVIDTNIFVSSFFGGNPKTIIDLWQEANIVLCLSPAIVEEYIRVMERLFNNKKEQEMDEIITLLRYQHSLYFVTKTPNIDVLKDTDDNKFIECAVKANAEHIVTGDKKHFGALDEYMGIKILTVKAFLATLQE
jgi:uncharacterized protein